jgi:putative acetyltransferase
VIVRPARGQDAHGAAVAFKVVAEEGRWIGREAPVDVAESAEQFRAWVASDQDHVWVLEHDGAIAGTIDLHRTSWASGVATLGMLVLPEARGKGGGRAMLDTALEWARESELYKIQLEVFVENARAIALYASAGFTVEGLRRDHYLRRDGQRHSTLIMALFV